MSLSLPRMLGGNPLAKVAVLVVENDPRMQKLLKDVLQAFGFRNVTFSANGQEGLEALDNNPIDLVILDWEMEPINGLEFLNRLRNGADSSHFYLPIIMITGKAERKDIEAARDKGVTEFLAKPFSVQLLRERIISIFEAPRQFVFSASYNGPCRRRKRSMPPNMLDRRSDD